MGANKNPGHSEENNDVTQLPDISPLALGVLEKPRRDRAVIILSHGGPRQDN